MFDSVDGSRVQLVFQTTFCITFFGRENKKYASNFSNDQKKLKEERLFKRKNSFFEGHRLNECVSNDGTNFIQKEENV